MARVKQVARFRVNAEGAVERIPQRPVAPACDRNKPPVHVAPAIAKAKGRKGGKDKNAKKSRKEDETETESSSSDADEV